MSTATYEKCQLALRLYRHIMKLHIRRVPDELRLFGKFDNDSPSRSSPPPF